MTGARLIGLLALTAVLCAGCAAELRQPAPATPARSSAATAAVAEPATPAPTTPARSSAATAAVAESAPPAPASRPGPAKSSGADRPGMLVELSDLVAAWEHATGNTCEAGLRNHVPYAAESMACGPHAELAVFDLESDRNDYFAALASQADTRPWVAGEYWAVHSPALDYEEFARQHGGKVLTPR